MSRALFSIALIALAGCIDTALTLVVEVEEASAEVTGERLTVEVTSRVRVGTHALAGDNFTLPRASLLVGGEPAAEVVLERPEGFTGRLEPGEETQIVSRGSVDLAAYPNARALLCAGGEVTFLLGWQAAEQPDDPLDPPLMSFGNAEGTTRDVTCD